jgi:predicted transcriptional regulator
LKYRSNSDITNEILKSLAGGSLNKTQIKYKAFLSTKEVRSYLPKLLEGAIIEYNQDTGLYNLTENGLKLLSLSSSLKEHFSKS